MIAVYALLAVAWVAMGYALVQLTLERMPAARALPVFYFHILAQLTWPFWLLYGVARAVWR